MEPIVKLERDNRIALSYIDRKQNTVLVHVRGLKVMGVSAFKNDTGYK